MNDGSFAAFEKLGIAMSAGDGSVVEGEFVEVEGCQWFARCDRPATGNTPHPVLGPVPTCDRCHTFATGDDRR